MEFINAAKKLPDLPKDLPGDTPNEKGILFINRKHSAAYFWYPSYGQHPMPYTTEDGLWKLEDYEWLNESDTPYTPSMDGKEEETKSSDMVGFIKEYIQKKGVDVVRKEFEEVGKQFQQVAEETKPTDEKEYFSPYPQEVAYTTDKNFLVRLKALIDARITEYGFELGDRKAAFFDSFRNAELYLFGSKFPTPSVAAQTALLGKETFTRKDMIDFAEFLAYHTTIIREEKITLYRYHDAEGWGNYTLDDILKVFQGL